VTSALSDQARALLAARLRRLEKAAQERTQEHISPAEIARLPQGSPPVMSFAQERLWFMEQLKPGTSAYVMWAVVGLKGRLRTDLLALALSDVAARHEALRMYFPAAADGRPDARIAPSVDIPFRVVRRDPDADPDARAWSRRVVAEQMRPFDLTAAPLLRAMVAEQGPDDHVLHVAMHHIISDGWSRSVLMRDWAACYAARLGVGSAPPESSVQYGDYAAWQRDRAESAKLVEADLAFWRQALDGVPPLELPTDRPRPAEFTTGSGGFRIRFPHHLTEALHGLGRSHRATLFMVLLAGLHTLLHRVSGQRDFAVGAPVAGRVRPELERVIGLFVNMLPLRATIHNGMTFAELLKQTRDRVLGALEHQELPFERMVQELAVPRDTSRTPLFQVMFAMHNKGEGPQTEWPGLSEEPFESGISSSRNDISLYIDQDARGMFATFAYRGDLFDEATISRLGRSLFQLLAAAAAAPDAALSDLDIMPPRERETVLGFGTGTVIAETHGGGLDEVITPHVLARPSAPAIVQDGQTLSYAELDAGANRFVRWLTAQGIGRGDLVGVCLEQSPRLAMVLLGVLRAGAAYVPLDPEQPPARTELMLRDARPACVLTDLRMVELWPQIEQLSPGPVPRVVGPADLAYVIYTSGSTGTPKGVAVAHRQVCNYLAGVAARFEVVPGARWALLQSLSFDFAVTVFYLGLASGGAVHLVPRRSTADELARYLRESEIDYLKITPSHLAALAADVPDGGLLPRKALILGGEASRLDFTTGLTRHGATVFNHYGPTEATVGVTTYRVSTSDNNESEGAGGTPIGTPLPHARVYVLDESLRPQPIGVPGQIFLGGDRLARGYLNRPGLTAERFLPDPFGPPGTRMYATGDIGRWKADGLLEFFGRIDNQIKIRGYRVELGEVEAALAALPGIAAAVAVLRGERLVGYLQGTANADTATLRMALADTLPDYMIPSQFVWLEKLPLQDHGKVDRHALPDPGAIQSTSEYVPPEGPLETALVTIWRQVLGLEQVGVLDDFFDLGGHSLQATQVVARLRRAVTLQRPISVMDLFRHRTIRALAIMSRSDMDGGAGRLLHELTPPVVGTRVRSYVCVPYGGANAVVYQPLADALPPGHSLYAVAVPGHDIGLAERVEPLAETARRCAEEIMSTVDGPLVVYGHCGPGGALAVEIARCVEAAGREIASVYLGGIFPFARPVAGVLGRISRLRLRERLRGDRVYANWLQGMGADLGALDDQQQRFLIRAMRHDAEAAEDYFTELLHGRVASLAAPIVCVVGQWDPGTEYHEERFKEWHFLAGTCGLVMIEEAGHYFSKFRAPELAQIITTVDKRLDQPVAPPDPQSPWNLVAVSRDAGSVSDSVPQSPRPGMRRFATVAFGQVVSAIGSALTAFAVPLWTYLETRSLLLFALYSVLAQAPGILVAPVAGAIIDRSDRRRAMIAGDVAAFVAIATFATFYFAGTLRSWHIYTFVGVLSVALTFQRLAYLSAVPQLVPKRYLGHANGLVQLAGGITGFIVPLIAVGLVATVGLGGILLIDLASFIFVIVMLLVVRFPRTMPRRRRESMAAEIANGLRFTVRHRGIRAMVLFFAAFNLFLAPLFLLVSPLVLSFAPLESVAQVSLAAGVGTVLGGLIMTVWGGPRKRKMRGMLLLALVFAAAGVVAGLRPSILLIGAGVLGLTCSLALINGVWLTIVQTKVPQRLHARVIAMNMIIALSTMPLGQALLSPIVVPAVEPLMQPGGLLAGTAGIVVGVGPGRGIGLLYAVCGLAIALVVAISLRTPRLARFDDDVPDAPPDDLVGLQAWQSRMETAHGNLYSRR